MRATIIAAVILLGTGVSSAFADGSGSGPVANTQFAETPGYIAHPAFPVSPVSAAPTGFAMVYVPGQATPVTPFSNTNPQKAQG